VTSILPPFHHKLKPKLPQNSKLMSKNLPKGIKTSEKNGSSATKNLTFGSFLTN
jgi:hypothetical protein